jgi:hypothetical protein
MYIRVLFMSEFPGLRHIVKIRDFFPYLRVQSDPLAKMAGTKPVRLATLQIHTEGASYSSDPHQRCQPLFRSTSKVPATLQINIEGVATLQIHTEAASYSSDPH